MVPTRLYILFFSALFLKYKTGFLDSVALELVQGMLVLCKNLPSFLFDLLFSMLCSTVHVDSVSEL